MIILAKSIKGQEFLYSRSGVVVIPKSWKQDKINIIIDVLNKHFKLSEQYTYHKHEIDEYSMVWPDYKAYSRNGNFKIKSI